VNIGGWGLIVESFIHIGVNKLFEICEGVKKVRIICLSFGGWFSWRMMWCSRHCDHWPLLLHVVSCFDEFIDCQWEIKVHIVTIAPMCQGFRELLVGGHCWWWRGWYDHHCDCQPLLLHAVMCFNEFIKHQWEKVLIITLAPLWQGLKGLLVGGHCWWWRGWCDHRCHHDSWPSLLHAFACCNNCI